MTKFGKPEGISPITDTSNLSNIATAVRITSATSDAGTALVNRGKMKTVATVKRDKAAAAHIKLYGSVGNCRMMASGSEDGGSAPSIGNSCWRMMMTPMPLMNPDMTG